MLIGHSDVQHAREQGKESPPWHFAEQLHLKISRLLKHVFVLKSCASTSFITRFEYIVLTIKLSHLQ